MKKKYRSTYMFYFSDIVKNNKLYFIIRIFYTLWKILYPVILLYLPKMLLDSIVEYNNLHKFFNYIIIYSISIAVNIIISKLFAIYEFKIFLLSKKRMTTDLLDKIKNLKVELYDNSETYNMIQRSIKFINNSGNSLIIPFFDLIISIGTLISIIMILIKINAYLLVFIVIIMIINYLIKRMKNKNDYKYEKETTTLFRKRNYILSLFGEKCAYESIISMQGEKFLSNELNHTTDEYIKKWQKYECSTSKFQIVSDFLFNSINVIATIVFGLALFRENSFTVGDYTLLINSSVQFSVILNMFFSTLQVFNRTKLDYIDYNELINLLNEADNNDKPVIKDFIIEKIELRDVSYKYHDAKDYALEKVNLIINKGEKIAFVGLNGAGKTTLIKIISGLIRPTSGQILINDLDISEYDIKEYYNHISLILQKTILFDGINILNNIILGNEERLINCTKLCNDGQLYDFLDNNYDEMKRIDVSPRFSDNGRNFSGGEFQKMIIGRGIVKESDILIMDEPSNSLDPINEKKIFDYIYKLKQDQTIIFVSHRLYSVMGMSKIYVFNKGEIVEFGNHDLLINKNGLYKELCLKQKIIERKE